LKYVTIFEPISLPIHGGCGGYATLFLCQFAFQGAPKDAEVVKAREKIYTARAEKEPCLMARNIYASTAASKL
jgi:hypothetical protein